MPEKSPDFWTQVWLVLSNPLWKGAIMAATISLLRVLYEGKEANKWRVVLEALIYGALSLSASSVIEWMDRGKDWPVLELLGQSGEGQRPLWAVHAKASVLPDLIDGRFVDAAIAHERQHDAGHDARRQQGQRDERHHGVPDHAREAQCIDLSGTLVAAGGYIYVQPATNLTLSNLVVGDVIEMVAAPEIVGTARGILGWEAELIVTKPVGGTSSLVCYRSMASTKSRSRCRRTGRGRLRFSATAST